ncbi:MAG: hypothetical protein AAGD11_18810 [Planctomycetota bacterium]
MLNLEHVLSWLRDALWRTPKANRVGQQPIRRQAMSRCHAGAKVYRDRAGKIRRVRIGRWRVVSAKPQRKIVAVREIDDGRRIALQIELADPFSMSAVATVWEFYDSSGRLDSMLQSTDDSCLWLQTRCSVDPDPSPAEPAGGESSFQVPAWS